MSLKNKKILITAGPTWVAIDPVRVISNIATGKTAKIIAMLAKAKGAQVRLLLGPTEVLEEIKGVGISRFRYFEELQDLISQETKKYRFDCIIHNAAVSDFLVEKISAAKLDSNKNKLNLRLIRAPKIIAQIIRRSPKSLLIMFKLEAGVSIAELIKRARRAQEEAGADIVVANTFKTGRLRAFIYNHRRLLAKADSRQALAKRLVSILEKRL